MSKAGEGNRTLVFSLEGYGSTIELHPQARIMPVRQWGVQDSNLRRLSHQIYSLTPLTARETPRDCVSISFRLPAVVASYHRRSTPTTVDSP